jgi:hypothetical protein
MGPRIWGLYLALGLEPLTPQHLFAGNYLHLGRRCHSEGHRCKRTTGGLVLHIFHIQWPIPLYVTGFRVESIIHATQGVARLGRPKRCTKRNLLSPTTVPLCSPSYGHGRHTSLAGIAEHFPYFRGGISVPTGRRRAAT